MEEVREGGEGGWEVREIGIYRGPSLCRHL